MKAEAPHVPGRSDYLGVSLTFGTVSWAECDITPNVSLLIRRTAETHCPKAFFFYTRGLYSSNYII